MNSISCYRDNFDEMNYFKDFHHYEVYDENKIYNENIFEHNYGKGIYNYQFCKFTIYCNGDVKKYVAAELQLTEEELILYSKYCQCPKCTAPWYSSWTYCGCCYGCLNSAFPQQWVIGETIKHYNNL